MLYYAFKNAEVAGGIWSKAISWKTGGPYSHVELWLSGPKEEALCFSSREGSGCGFKIINLSETPGLWTLVPLQVSPEAEERIFGFAQAMASAKVRYDYLGILGIGTGHGEHDDHNRFCSEVLVEAPQKCDGRWPDVKRWMVDPSMLYKMAKSL